MANQLKMARIQAILGLLEQGWSHRRIARELGVHRETVGRYDRLRREAGSKPAIVTLGSSPRPPGQVSLCEQFRGVILQKLESRLSAQRIWQGLVAEHGFEGSYSSVKRNQIFELATGAFIRERRDPLLLGPQELENLT